jgi:hypothetical protein
MTPDLDSTLVDWWLTSRKRIHKDARKSFDTFMLLVSWSIWKERNNRVFNGVSSQPQRLAKLVLEEGPLWVVAGFCLLSEFVQ